MYINAYIKGEIDIKEYQKSNEGIKCDKVSKHQNGGYSRRPTCK